MHLDGEAILFDIDGTLVDSGEAVLRSWRAWALAVGVDPDAVAAVCHGRRSADTVADFVAPADRGSARELIDRLELGDLDGVRALPGAREVLARLPAERWGAVTSGSHALMTARMAAAGLPIPAQLVTAAEVAVGKPDPQGYRLAARLLGVDVTRCVVVEDAPAGIRAGVAAGARVLALSTTHARADLGGADAVVTDLSAVRVRRHSDLLRLELTT